MEEKLLIRPWKKNISEEFALAILGQVKNKKIPFLSQEGAFQIPVEILYGFFALKSIHSQWLFQNLTPLEGKENPYLPTKDKVKEP